MSGIERMTERIKKKMSLDDLPTSQQKNTEQYESTAVHTEVLPDAHTTEHQSANTDIHHDALLAVHPVIQNSVSTESIVVPENTIAETQEYRNPAITQIQQNSYAEKQSGKSPYGRKMTLYLTDELYKAFNDIYAQRMLDGRKTEKAALICEAVELLVKHENLRKGPANK